MSPRSALPNRRAHEILSFYHWSQKFHAGIGRASPAGPIMEVWLNTGKTGTQAETLARDSAVLLSLALQYGVPVDAMRSAIMRDMDGRASGPIGVLLDMLAEGDGLSESGAVLPVVPIAGSDCVEPAV